MNSLLDMRAKPGDPILAEHWNALLDWLRATQILGGANVRVSRTPNGTFVNAQPGAIPVAGAFDVQLGSDGSGQVATVARGLVEGIEPMLRGVKISGDAKDPAVPAPKLALPKPSAAEGYIYLECKIAKESWRITSIEPVFLAEPPAPKEWTAYKLLAILRQAGEGESAAWSRAHQAVHFDLGHYPYGRKSSGKARHLFFAR